MCKANSREKTNKMADPGEIRRKRFFPLRMLEKCVFGCLLLSSLACQVNHSGHVFSSGWARDAKERERDSSFYL